MKPFDLRDDNIENMAVTVGPGVVVRGQIVPDGGTVSAEGLRVMLNVKTGALPFAGGATLANDDLSFEIPNVQPGEYNVNLFSSQGPMVIGPASGMPQSASFYVREVRVDGKNVVEQGFAIHENAPVPSVEVVLDFSGGAVTGRVLDKEDKPISRVQVALVSADPEKRKLDRYFRSGAADQNGQYTLNAIIPGDYLLLVWPESDVARIQDPELFARLEEHAVRVTVDKSATAHQDLTLTSDIQTIAQNSVE